MAFDAFSDGPKSTQVTTTQSWSNSNNKAFSSTQTTDNQGNTTLSIGGGGILGTADIVPMAIGGLLLLGGIFLLTRKT